MMDAIFDHDRLDVYRLAIEYTAASFAVAKNPSGLHRHARDQWLRASQSIPLNIAEGNGKRGAKDRARFFEIARGSALECSAIQDVLAASEGLDDRCSRELKSKLKRIVSMLTRMVMRRFRNRPRGTMGKSHTMTSTSTAMLSTSTKGARRGNPEAHNEHRGSPGWAVAEVSE